MANYPWMQKPLHLLVPWILAAFLQNGHGFVVYGNKHSTLPNLAAGESNSIHDGAMANSEYSKRHRIEVESEIELPFSTDVAFDAFSDLRRQPSFSQWLNSVEYIDGWTENEVGSRSKWTISVSGFRFSWKSISKQLDRDNGIIEWGSVTGLRNEGKVLFSTVGQNTHMRLSMCIFVPKFAARIMGGDKVAKLIENRMLKPTLETFRQHLIADNDAKAVDNTTFSALGDNQKPSDSMPSRFKPVVPQDH